MTHIRWSPLREMERFFEEEWFPQLAQASSAFVPAVDVYDKGDTAIVETPLAGVDPERVEIMIENDVLTIHGFIDERSEMKDNTYYRREVRKGDFVRAVTLPVPVKGSEAKATSKNGLLVVTLPKVEDAKPKAVKVDVERPSLVQ